METQEEMAAQLRDIAPPVEVFPYPWWMVVLAVLLALALLGIVTGLVVRFIRKPKKTPRLLPHELALRQLAAAREQIETTEPYAFSILVSDILRAYLADRYALPATRQTSPEFLAAASDSPLFSAERRETLGHFLEKTDLIKFARIDATTGDSRELCDIAEGVVKGGRP